jgi:RimJ/RimL family protein N-acetyltransferase
MLTPVAATERIVVRRMTEDDAAFVVELVNDPSWIRYIGDNGVRTLEDAQRYIRDGPVAMYAERGFGLYLVELRASGEPIGICGLIKRDGLADVDLGFAFLPRYRGLGYAREASRAVLDYARSALGLLRIVAIVSQDNAPSCRLLESLGFRHEGRVRLKADAAELALYAAADQAASCAAAAGGFHRLGEH